MGHEDKTQVKQNQTTTPSNGDKDYTSATQTPPVFQLEAGDKAPETPAQTGTKPAPPQSAADLIKSLKPEEFKDHPELKPQLVQLLMMLLSVWRANYPDHYKSLTDEIIRTYGDLGKEVVVREELFDNFSHEEGLSVGDSKSISGATKAKWIADKDSNSKLTSCVTIAQKLLEKSFQEHADVEIKKSHSIEWIPPTYEDDKKTVKTPGRKKKSAYTSTSYDFYGDDKAKETGSWMDPSNIETGGRPQMGDMYLLKSITGDNKGNLSHIGYVKFIETTSNDNFEIWHTFDGGQPVGEKLGTHNPDGSRTNIRVFDKKKRTLKVDYAKYRELKGLPPLTEAEIEERKKSGADKVNQDGEEKALYGWIDIGKLIKPTEESK
ncbi:MAG: hypothetical protein H6581_04815 [Bacteroidia bacterium]|nr:hypothetical protein [Bacteroidia bacterium]